MRWLLVLLVAAACAAPPAAEEPAGPSRRLRLATWNVHDLFDSVDDPYEDEVPAEADVEDKLSRLASVLREVDADLVALQEVENAGLLQRLGSRAGYPTMILEEGNDSARGIDVAFLSRVPLDGHRSHAADALPEVHGVPPGYRFSRDCLEVHLSPLVILVNHFKSQATGGRQADAKRRAQALRVREIAGDLPWVAVVGDLNAAPESWSLQPLLEGGLVDPFAGRPLDERATFQDRKRRGVLDYILVSPALAKRVVDARVMASPAVAEASDHRPVVVDFDLPLPGGGPSRTGEAPAR